MSSMDMTQLRYVYLCRGSLHTSQINHLPTVSFVRASFYMDQVANFCHYFPLQSAFNISNGW